MVGGTGDKQHLGGFTDIDMHGISPAVWKHVVANWTVQSVVDVGCGRGTSTSWFVTHGLRTECVEGSHDALAQSMVPDPSILTEHDFSRGPWWPAQTFDAVWSVEFLEHVGVPYHYNYMATFRKAAILLVTSSRWGTLLCVRVCVCVCVQDCCSRIVFIFIIRMGRHIFHAATTSLRTIQYTYI